MLPPNWICFVWCFFEILLGREIVLRRQVLVRIEVEQHAAECVGARLRDRVDDAAGRGAELGVELAGQELKLLHRFDRRSRLRAAVAAVERVVVAGAVERVVDVLRALAVDADRVRAEGVGRDERRHAWQRAQVGREVAVDRRDVVQLLRGDDAADLLRRGVDERRFRRDRDRLLDATERQADVNRRSLADLDAHGGALVFLEARQRRRQFVRARHQRDHRKRAVGAADRLAILARRFIGRNDGRSGQERALRVHDPAAQIAGS